MTKYKANPAKTETKTIELKENDSLELNFALVGSTALDEVADFKRRHVDGNRRERGRLQRDNPASQSGSA
jgi:hypothetical protein